MAIDAAEIPFDTRSARFDKSLRDRRDIVPGEKPAGKWDPQSKSYLSTEQPHPDERMISRVPNYKGQDRRVMAKPRTGIFGTLLNKMGL